MHAFIVFWALTNPQPRAMVAPIKLSHKRINAARIRRDDPDWSAAQREVYAEQNTLDRHFGSSTLQRFVIRRGPLHRKQIALTFDDGPHPLYTLALLSVLKEEKTPATFFVVGFMANRYPELIRAIKAGGHEIANHTYSHVTLTKLSPEEAMTEYRATNDVIKRLTGTTPKFCRPPGGDFNDSVLQSSADLGLTTVLWTDDPGDYSNPGDNVLLQREVAALKPGAIVLLHDGSANTMDTLKTFIRTAKAKGYQFVSLSQLD